MTPQLWTRFSGGTRNPAPRWVAYLSVALFVGFGVALLMSGIQRYDAAQPIAGGRTTVGTVVEVHTGQSCGHRHGCNPYWVPIIQFAANGHDFTFTGPQSNNSISTGDPVQVSYDPGNPAFARDISAGEGLAWEMIVFGAMAIIVGSGSFILGFRRLHARLNLTSARDASGWVGHSGLHSVRGIAAGVVALVAVALLLRGVAQG
jgi:uncharacterized protein DUF3592